MLLDGKPADFLSIGKCWGRIDVTLGTLRLTFQDFRAPANLPWPLPTPDNDILECHGEHVASYHAEYAQNSTRFVKNLFQDPTHLPAAIVFEGERRQDPNTYKELLGLPGTWSGPAILVNFRSQLNEPLDASPISIQERQRWERVFNRSLDMIDTADLIR